MVSAVLLLLTLISWLSSNNAQCGNAIYGQCGGTLYKVIRDVVYSNSNIQFFFYREIHAALQAHAVKYQIYIIHNAGRAIQTPIKMRPHPQHQLHQQY